LQTIYIYLNKLFNFTLEPIPKIDRNIANCKSWWNCYYIYHRNKSKHTLTKISDKLLDAISEYCQTRNPLTQLVVLLLFHLEKC